jgi:protein JSN1
MNQQAFDMQRTDSVDSNMSPYPQFGLQTPLFQAVNVPITPVGQLQYQQGMLGRAAAPLNNFYPNMNGGINGAFGGYSNPSSAIDQYRNQGMPNGSPIQPAQMTPSPMLGQNGFAPPGYGVGYGFGGMGMQNVGVGVGYIQQQEQVNGRRGRVSYR